MLNKKIEKALNEQLNAEMFSSYLYLSMSAYFESRNLKGMARWMRMQSQEEANHAAKIFDFIHERGGKVGLSKIDTPRVEWSSPLDVFEDTFKHESSVTSMINGLMELALRENDHAASTFLQWFVNEQVEEEAAVHLIAEKLRMVSDNPVAMFMIDNELGGRSEPAVTK